MTPLRPCLDCQRVGRWPARQHEGYRCDACRAGRDRDRNRTRAERARRIRAVAAWRAEHGDLCPGWMCPPHPATDLTADHVVPVARGGPESGPLAVLCRGCNGRKAARRAPWVG